MTDQFGELTPTSVLSQAQAVLAQSGYVIKREGLEKLRLPADRCFIAEDAYGIALIASYLSWSDVESNWRELQDSFVDALSVRVTKGNPKAWDAYMVLLVLSEVTSTQEREVGRVRRDTTRTRKLVAVGTELRTLEDVRRAVSPLLPIPSEDAVGQSADPISALSELLVGLQIDPGAVDVVVTAFRQNAPLLEELHTYLGSRH